MVMHTTEDHSKAPTEPNVDVAPAQDTNETDDILEPCASKAKRMRATKHHCRVGNCTAPLSLYYNWRYRICAEHRKAASVDLDGIPQRFCQLCGKFQHVGEFAGTKVSCEEALRLHNLRRRMNSRRRRNNDGQVSDDNDTMEALDARSKRARPTQRKSIENSPNTSQSNPNSSDYSQPVQHHMYQPPMPVNPNALGIVQPIPRRLGSVQNGFSPLPEVFARSASAPVTNKMLATEYGVLAEQRGQIGKGFMPWNHDLPPVANGQSDVQPVNFSTMAAIKQLLTMNSQPHNIQQYTTDQGQGHFPPAAASALDSFHAIPSSGQHETAKPSYGNLAQLIGQVKSMNGATSAPLPAIKTERGNTPPGTEAAAAGSPSNGQTSAADVLRIVADLMELGNSTGAPMGDLMSVLANAGLLGTVSS